MTATTKNNYTLGSLFSGSGGFELGGVLNGFNPLWNSEIKPFPMLVTHKNFPDTIQLGNISEINGGDIPATDVVTFGSPCFPAGTLILTNKGYKPIEKIEVGDEVLSHKNRFKKVVRTGGTPQQDIYELNAQGILPIKATGNHPFIVRTIKDKDNFTFTEPYQKQLHEMSDKDYIGVPVLSTEENPLNFAESELYDLGRYMGQKYNLAEEKDNYINYGNTYIVLNEKTKKFANKEEIPFEILNLPTNLIKAYAKGYFEYDVSYMKHKTFCKTESFNFAIGLSLAIQKAFKTGCYICKSKVFSTDRYIVSFNPSPKTSPNYFIADNIVWYPVYDVKKLDIQSDVFNIEVEEDHTYVAQNCIVHNCQDLSQAGKREGLNGSRSSLFYEAIRIIKEMRLKSNGEYPKYIVWENVYGALTSHQGNDFRIVLEEIAKIEDKTATIPMPSNGKWLTAGEIMADNYSIAWRTLDAQWWGVPQRRRRIYLIADLTGRSAGDLLFKFESLSGYSPQSCYKTDSFGSDFSRNAFRTNNKFSGTGRNDREISSDLRNDKDTGISETGNSDSARGTTHILNSVASTLRSSAGAPKHSSDIHGRLVIGFCGNNSATAGNLSQAKECSPVLSCTKRGSVLVARGFDAYNSKLSEDTSGTLGVNCGISTGGSTVLCVNKQGEPAHNNHPIVLDRAFYNQGVNAQYSPKTYSDETVPTLVAQKQPPLVVEDKSICLQGSMIGRKDKNGPQGNGINEEVSFTLNTLDRHAVTSKKTARRFTPLECGRLQGFPDFWCEDLATENPTEEEIDYWWNVWETYRKITDDYKKPKTKKQIEIWLQNPTSSDEPMYVMWGNGVALPNVDFIMAAIKWGLDRKTGGNIVDTN